ncbi:unnamed protein product [Clonostachys byssicola]|uniref:aldehyde dehydrogenase (NAD(+)) n=1 Tax=Clonostachys byssicola TaxID=160290 RepID=A0A9N9Y739_9HYPO|nr:unnamed protein product [Clonostachys byssicola]
MTVSPKVAALRRQMIGHGSWMLMSCLLGGVGLWMYIIGGFEIIPGFVLEFGLWGDEAGWLRCHTGPAANAFMVIVSALGLPYIDMPDSTAEWIGWIILMDGWSNVGFYFFGNMSPNRGLAFGKSRLGPSNIFSILALGPAYFFGVLAIGALGYVNSKSGNTFKIRNPADDSLVASDIHVAGPKDVDDAVAAATAAFNGPWRTLTGAQRGELLHKFADLLDDHLGQVAGLETQSMGIPISISKLFASVAVSYFHYYAGYADKLEGDAFPADDGVYKIVQNEPLGVVASIASWNTIPLYFGWKIAPALATGNTVIFKASEKSPLGALALGRLFVKAGFPPGIVNLVTGGGETGHLLASHQKIRKISFTGLVTVGRKVQEAATKSNLKRVTLELGGKSPAIVFDDADLDQAVSAISQGFLLNSGQVCAAASRVYVHKSVVSEFVATLKANFEGAMASQIESGTVAVNSAFLPSPSTAFGGFKQSGNGGRESGKYALRDYLQTKTIHIK